MKNNIKRNLIVGSIIVILGLLFYLGVSQTIFPEIRLSMNCGSTDYKILGCSIENLDRSSGITGVVTETFSIGIGNTHNLKKNWINVYGQILEEQNTEYLNFINSHEYCGQENTRAIFKAPEYYNNAGVIDKSSSAYINFGATLTSDFCGGGRFPPNRQILISGSTITDKYFDKQLIIMEGTYASEYSTESGNFKISGFCDMNTGSCIFKTSDIAVSNPSLMFFNPTSIKINLKVDGFDENNVCIEDGIERCDGEEYQVCSNNEFVNEGLIEGKCGYAIEEEITQEIIDDIIEDVEDEVTEESTEEEIEEIVEDIINEIEEEENIPLTEEDKEIIKDTIISDLDTSNIDKSKSIFAENVILFSVLGIIVLFIVFITILSLIKTKK